MTDTMFKNYPDIVEIKDLCNMLRIGKNTAYELISDGKLKSIRIGKIHKIPKKYILDFLGIAG